MQIICVITSLAMTRMKNKERRDWNQWHDTIGQGPVASKDESEETQEKTAKRQSIQSQENF